MACNGLFGAASDGMMINPPDPNRTFELKMCEIAVFDREAYDLSMDFRIIREMATEFDPDSVRGQQALFTGNKIMDICFNVSDRQQWPHARQVAQGFLSHTNGTSQHRLHVVGHCHIDLGWLWPYAETRRKAARSFSSQIALMERYPEYKFAQSQAQIYEWVKQDYPELYDSIRKKVQRRQFIPVGGSWVEMCGILPSGESMARQMIYGQRFFQREFGITCTEFWLPDSFGYSGQLPQILRKSGIESFVTQKISWNTINKFPNSTFMWRALDGTEILSHFPPNDNYVARVDVKDLLFNVKNYKDKDVSNHSLMLFGYGDGGGGPTMEHLERIKRCRDVDGLPILISSTPKEFFDEVRKEMEQNGLRYYDGELYMEGHRGTYTSQASTKRGNRKSEMLLRDVEWLSVLAVFAGDDGRFQYPRDSLESLWRLVLLNQFHDVLPGSSIKLVHDDALKYYHQVLTEGQQIRHEALSTLSLDDSQTHSSKSVIMLNTLSFSRDEIVELPKSFSPRAAQKSRSGYPLAVVLDVPSMGYRRIDAESLEPLPADRFDPVQITTSPFIAIENRFMRVEFDDDTGGISVFDKNVKRYVVTNGNRFTLQTDTPFFWSAWDVEVYSQCTRRYVGNKPVLRVVEDGPLRATVELSLQLTETSKLRQYISVTAISSRIDFHTEVDWIDEKNVMLKVSMPTSMRATQASYEIQFGHVKRPTHRNTSWDVAQFEVHGQKWADVSEYGYGVSLLNDCKYGYSCEGGELSLSLLKAPKAPDDKCDMGHHEFIYSLYMHAGTLQEGGTIREGYTTNVPLIVTSPIETVSSLLHTPQYKSFIGTNQPGIVVESVKLSEDDDKAIIVRLYESYGGSTHGSTLMNVSFGTRAVRAAHLCDILEREQQELPIEGSNMQTVNLGVIHAFEIVSVKIRF